ncbi:hypothetical protein VQ02_22010 [Methylobacterium variabile]|jgi:hypothetical protein|uniref:Uncharacterized protein n=2 Tax=Methylobacterium TaxID=407 RepID=A0A0J6SI91_9HYPH|nr:MULTISPECIES: hypothetical protein [Methylobacterium]KMO33053.1 hypothetical protein VQ02_22010 [Methylobacterium variabile]KMO37506.1 hypothetical protein VP06_08245 [Methylobacterium aquaticum]
MGEYVMTTVTIGGPLEGAQAVAGLIAATGRYFAEAERLVHEALAEGTSVTFEDLQDFGLTSDLDAYCQKHGLSYLRTWCARSGVFDAGLRHWRPGLASPAAELADDGGEPVMTLAALRNAHEAGEGLPEILARLDQAVSTAVPPLTLAPREAVGARVQVAA